MSDPVTGGQPTPAERPTPSPSAEAPTDTEYQSDRSSEGEPRTGSATRRRRGSRGGRNRSRAPRAPGEGGGDDGELGSPDLERQPDELPDRPFEGRPQDPAVAERALVRKPQIGDSRPAPATAGDDDD